MGTLFYSSLAFFFTFLLYNQPEGAGAAVGINYGLIADNLPPPSKTISRLHQLKVDKIRIFSPDKAVLTALHNSGISVVVGTFNEDLDTLASGESAAATWVKAHILPHHHSVNITCVAAGNEVYPGQYARYIPDAMRNLDAALAAAGLSIPVSTAISMAVLSSSYPPSTGSYSDAATPLMEEIAGFLSEKKYPLLVNIYPYWARAGDPVNVKLEYAIFKKGTTVVRDGKYTYLNIFDAMLDASYAALEKAGFGDVEIVVSETGWPTDGGQDASVENAEWYVNSLISHVSSGKGTPRRPGREIKTYIFAMFNEDQKPEGVERHWGLHYPNLTQVYHVDHF